MQTDLKIKTINTTTGKTITSTVSYVNASASSGVLKELAYKLNNLTTNNYVSTDRVQTINIDTEEIPQQGV